MKKIYKIILPLLMVTSTLWSQREVTIPASDDPTNLSDIFTFITGDTLATVALLVVFFTYFYTAIQFDPERQADMIQRQGGFIPGIRPGRATVNYLQYVLSRITLPGALYLALVTVLPSILGYLWNVPVGLSGVSIIIVAGVALETTKQIESQLMMRNYEGFLA